MKELYTISVLGTLSAWLTAIAIISIFVTVACGVAYFICASDDDCDKENLVSLKKTLKRFIILGIATLIPSILIPSKTELYVIYGVGNVIDYIQENPETQELPDKTVKFLNAVADDYLNKHNSKEDERRK
jgi:hypothetical protein